MKVFYLIVSVCILNVSYLFGQQTITIVTTTNEDLWNEIEFVNSGQVLQWHAVGPGIDQYTSGNNPYFDFFANSNNELIEITITSNDNFEYTTELNANSAEIESVDISSLQNLLELRLGQNNLTSIDVTGNLNLELIALAQNNITEIDLSQNQNLKYFYSLIGSFQSFDFSNNQYLIELNAGDNQVNSMNISNNPNLEIINLNGSNLSSINLANVPVLKELYLHGNNLSDLTLVNNSSLEKLSISSNDLTSIDLSFTPELNFLNISDNSLMSLDVSSNPNLEVLFAENISSSCIIATIEQIVAQYINWYYDTDTLLSIDCINSSPYAYIPDNNFEQALIDLGHDDILDDYVLTDNVRFIQSLTINDRDIDDITGIENFYSLENLFLNNNNIFNIDVSNLINLTFFEINNNFLSELDVSENCHLFHLYVNSNDLNFIETNLNMELYRLSVWNNNLTFIDVSNNHNLDVFNVDSNPILCIQVNNDQINNIPTQWSKPGLAIYSINCESEQYTYIPDDNFEQYLINQNKDYILDDYVLTENIIGMTHIDVNNSSITNLSGIEDFINLTTLIVNDNFLTEIDLSNNSSIEFLLVYNNQLSDINTSNLELLEYFACDFNQLTSLDVSNNSSLVGFSCTNNSLNSLNIKNGNNQNMTNGNFGAYNNPELNCIQVDDANYSSINWTNIDAQHFFSEDCSTLNVEELNQSLFRIYPNPTNGVININIDSNYKFQLIDITGKQIKSGNLLSGQNQISLNGLISGIYFLKVENEKGRVVKKIIKN